MIKNILLVAALMAGVYGSGCATKLEIKTGYNALETAVTHETDARHRLWTDVEAIIGDLTVKENGMNQITNADPDTHYGRNVLVAGKEDLGTYLCTVVKTAADKVIDVKAGIRNTSIIEMIGGYGYIDITGEKDAVNITLWYLKDFGKGWFRQQVQRLFAES